MTTQFTPSTVDTTNTTDAQASGGADRELVAAARMLLARMNVDPADLMTDPADRPPVPTFDEYIPQVEDAVSPGTAKTYGSYWNRIRVKWGSRSLLEPTPTEIKQFAEEIKANAVQRRNSRGGRGTAENFIAALRCIYRHAEDDGLIKLDENPARRTAKPRRQGSVRHALSANQMSEINFYAGTTGDDPELDTMLLRLHTESACRTGGALALRPRDLNADQCLIYLREKDGTARWQPVSRSLMAALLDHAEARGAAGDPGGQLLRYRNGNPITHRRYDHLWVRLGRYLPWITTLNVSAHWIRHTTLTWVERNFGFAIAHAYAGHFDDGDTKNATMTYVKAAVHDVATALSALTGEPHPLAA
jgi:integrase/recombinase XerC